MEDFTNRFQFSASKALYVGVERECFLTQGGKIVPIAPQVLPILPVNGRFGYELSACQLEERIGPCQVADLATEFLLNEAYLAQAEQQLRFQRLWQEVAPETMPLDVYPDPSGRYQQLVQQMPKQVLLAACRVAGIHIHVGMPDPETALKVYNQVIPHCATLCRLGDHSQGQRLAIYRQVAPNCDPLPYSSWAEFYQNAKANNFAENPRNCWTLIRISVHGTIEFRTFGLTANVTKIISWAKICYQLCLAAMYH